MGKSKTQTSGVDNVTAGRQHDAWVAAQGYANQHLAPVDPSVIQAKGYDQGVAAQGQTGLSALSGDVAAQQQLMNPYESDVINGVNSQWGRQAANVQNSIAGQFAKSGAFGGTRQGVATGVGLGEVANNQMQQIGQLQYQGFNDSMNRASQLANLGLAGNADAASLGQYQTAQAQADQAHGAQTLLAAASALQHGQTATQSGDLFGDLLGGAQVASSFIGGPHK